MTIEYLIERLTELTKADECKWEYMSGSTYRLVLDNGAIQIKAVPISEREMDYIVKLFDQDSCFATYNTEVDTTGYLQFSDLYSEILDSITRATEKRIDDVFGGLI